MSNNIRILVVKYMCRAVPFDDFEVPRGASRDDFESEDPGKLNCESTNGSYMEWLA